MAIMQESGAQGFNPQTSQGFDVEVVNQLKEPTSIHWHGLVVPALMDGVPFVSQEPIPPNGKFHYQFPAQAKRYVLDALALRSARSCC